MTTSKFYLDTRRKNKQLSYPLKLLIGFKGKYFYISLNIKLQENQWDVDKERIINHPNKLALNAHIIQQKNDIDFFILQHSKDYIEASEFKKAIEFNIFNKEEKANNNTLFKYQLESFIADKKKSTQDIYKHTLKRINDFTKNIDNLQLKDISYDWLVAFENYLAQTANKNARNIHLRNIRAIFNHAISNDIQVKYPFKKFKIRPVPTAKRSLTVDELRTLFNFPVEEYAQIHLDMFKLIFYLIGINIVDLFNLETITMDGRIEFYRAKTNRLYSIKVEPEAFELICKYQGDKKLLCMADTYKKHNDYAKHMNRALQHIGHIEYGKRGKKTITPLFPELTTYWARHTWATIASSLDIPKDTIAAALGHGAYTVTDIYINFDRKKIDNANRKVLDWVLYNKK